ncbi:hypothetical protein ACQEVM_13465 [Streptomyces sp. CA-243310]|uniref:hypothetical protein n=1 Tax=Streptomyces sp. CA-243310 TaxID=3240056 RepID=UPI003D94FE9E
MRPRHPGGRARDPPGLDVRGPPAELGARHPRSVLSARHRRGSAVSDERARQLAYVLVVLGILAAIVIGAAH